MHGTATEDMERGEVTGSHQRGTISVGSDHSVDDGPVIDFYMDSGDVVDETQYRIRNDGSNLRALVTR